MNEKKEKNESIRNTAKTAQNKPKRTYNRKPKTENKAADNTKPKRNAQKPQTERKSVPQRQPQTGLKRRYSGRTPQKPLKIIPLGGLGEIGKNITLYEYDGDMMLVDCGMAFPDEEMPGYRYRYTRFYLCA